MTVQFIRTPDGGELAVLPREEYEELLDGRTADRIADALARSEEETLSSSEVRALLAAPSPLAFWREKRGVPSSEMARSLGVSPEHLADIEAGRQLAPLPTYGKAARLLRVSLDDLAVE